MTLGPYWLSPPASLIPRKLDSEVSRAGRQVTGVTARF